MRFGLILQLKYYDQTNKCSITSLSTGTFFAIATYQRNLPVMLASLPGRLFAAVIFHRNGGGWSQVAIFETAMAAVMGAALLWDYYL